MKRLFVAMLILLLSASCSGRYFGPVKGQNDMRAHVVHVGWDGNFYEIPAQRPIGPGGGLQDPPIDAMIGYERTRYCSGGDGVDKCLMDQQKQVQKDAFKVITDSIDGFNTFDKDGYKQVVLFIHGGLNTREKSLERDIRQAGKMMAAGKFPIFINWRSGAVTCLRDHYFRIRDGEISPEAPGTAPVYMVFDLLKVVGNAPMAWWKESQNALDATAGRDDAYIQSYTTARDGILFSGDDLEHKKTLRSLWWIVTSPVKIITTPFVFTLGKPAWDNMKRRVHTQFVRPGDLKERPDTKTLVKAELTPKAEGATLAFLRDLNAYMEKRPKVRVTLIGHSMGAIILNRILTQFPDLPVTNIVYMASADTLQNFIDASVPFLRKRNAAVRKRAGKDVTRVFSLHLHPENEDREDNGYGATPSGSLLVWIDHSYEEPEYTLQRTAGRWSNMRQVVDLIPDDVRPAYHFKIFGRSENECFAPQKHGAFDDDDYFPYWDESYWWVGETGYCE
jgi:pimeloyl-ACP methyl ester carboxylesterase